MRCCSCLREVAAKRSTTTDGMLHKCGGGSTLRPTQSVVSDVIRWKSLQEKVPMPWMAMQCISKCIAYHVCHAQRTVLSTLHSQQLLATLPEIFYNNVDALERESEI